MRNTVAKRIRKANKAAYPIEKGQRMPQYIADIRQLSKENKALLKNGLQKSQQPKVVISKRQLRRGGKKGFPVGCKTLFPPLGRKFKSGARFKVIANTK